LTSAINITTRSPGGGAARRLDLLTLKEAATQLRVCVKTARRLIKKHNIPVIQVGNRIMVPVEHLVMFVTKKW
jgi:excisionase family DNA binding protein